MRSNVATLFNLALLALHVSAGGNDWVSPSFVLKKSGASGAQKTIASYAKSSANKGPWTVYGDASILPPNNDKRDYLSWAPYHWPNCNWCQGGRAHLSTGGNRTNTDGVINNSTQLEPAEDGGDFTYGYDDDESYEDEEQSDEDDNGDDSDEVDEIDSDADGIFSVPFANRKMIRRSRSAFPVQLERDVRRRNLETSNTLAQPDLLPLPTELPGEGSASTSDVNEFSPSETGVENARKTSKPKSNGKTTHKAAPTKTKGSSGTCTPSPTKSFAPSATWTTCEYVVRDGKVNPDVRQLHGVQAIADASQSIIYNAIASVLTGSASYAQSAANAINVFFLDSQTGMHARIPYGQLIRGPQKQTGQYIGVLDFRGMVKVANAVLILQNEKSPAWTSALDSKMQTWTAQYVQWLQTSAIGKKAISAPNNHGTFAVNQVAAMHILAGDTAAAADALNSYFSGPFLDQIAASGEQPFEAVRTRPFHYRCFNLEAMITNAKLGDELGLDFWSAKSKYGATIKDALDYVMKKGPGKEKVTDILPHVATVAAVYGDPDGKYMAYLKKMDSHYLIAPYYYYDQSAVLSRMSSGKVESEVIDWAIESAEQETLGAEDIDSAPDAEPNLPWECPAVFALSSLVQLDDGLFVTCEELKPFYGYAADVTSAV